MKKIVWLIFLCFCFLYFTNLKILKKYYKLKFLKIESYTPNHIITRSTKS